MLIECDWKWWCDSPEQRLRDAVVRADPRCVIWAGTVRPQVARLRQMRNFAGIFESHSESGAGERLTFEMFQRMVDKYT